MLLRKVVALNLNLKLENVPEGTDREIITIIIIIIIITLGWQRPIAPISFAGNVHFRLQGPILGGWRLWSHHQSGAARSALDVRVVFSSPTEDVSRYGEHRHTGGHL